MGCTFLCVCKTCTCHRCDKSALIDARKRIIWGTFVFVLFVPVPVPSRVGKSNLQVHALGPTMTTNHIYFYPKARSLLLGVPRLGLDDIPKGCAKSQKPKPFGGWVLEASAHLHHAPISRTICLFSDCTGDSSLRFCWKLKLYRLRAELARKLGKLRKVRISTITL